MAAPGTYIIRRGATLVFRRRVPASLAKIYCKSFFVFSLRTHLVSEARRRAAIAARFTEDLIGLVEACGADMLDERDMIRVVDDLMRFEVEAEEAVRELGGPRSAESVEMAIRFHEATRDTLRAALVYNEYAAVHAPLERALSRLGLTIGPKADGFQKLARRCTRALIEVSDENIRRENGVYLCDAGDAGRRNQTPSQSLPIPGQLSLPPRPCELKAQMPASSSADAPAGDLPVPACAANVISSAARPASLDVSIPPTAVVLESAPAEPARTPAPAPQDVIRTAGIPGDPFWVDVNLLDGNSPFSDWFAAAITDKREGNPTWDTNNLSNWRGTKKLLIEAFGDRPISFFTNKMMKEFRGLLQTLPKNHHKSSDSPGLYQIIEDTEIEEARKLALAEGEIEFCELNRGEAEQARARARIARVRVATVYRHLQAIQFIFRLAADHGAASQDVMKKVLWSTYHLDKLKAEEKVMKRLAWGDKLPDLLNTTAFVAPLDGEVHAVFWPTLIAAHAGLRMEEALQLKTADFDTIDGIPVFRIQSGEGQHLKSAAAARIIPIHQNLLDLGLLRFVDERWAQGQEWLFPEIERCAAKGRLSGTFTKVFTHYRISEGVYDPLRDFHSLRTNVNVMLKRRQCPIRKRLIGHELNDVTEEHYDPDGSPVS